MHVLPKLVGDPTKVLSVLGLLKRIDGRIRFQKIIYLLQQYMESHTGLKNDNFSYDYYYYTYGPFSKELAEDITWMSKDLRIINEEEPNSDQYAYTYSLNDDMIDKIAGFFNVKSCELSSIEMNFSNMKASIKDTVEVIDKKDSEKRDFRVLELVATIVYICRNDDFDIENKDDVHEELKKRKGSILEAEGGINRFDEAYELAKKILCAKNN